ncbi:MAG: hypothetical protein A3D15_02545 [Alphaproteobacteria bacterium RIFCSPHIGHO2_02_FULL_40_34]|nr:MAG: hypothetical protein A3D15_02545 [Alphaproteobacteria bacterium RIFCSPHIGHO2_02_FULL_40_34]OFW86073.1 MAG: hypothetical protein A2794_03530 [Alphaproteobacteria bacterium RIFCSPHIGHO2_01_FULL_40_8]
MSKKKDRGKTEKPSADASDYDAVAEKLVALRIADESDRYELTRTDSGMTAYTDYASNSRPCYRNFN